MELADLSLLVRALHKDVSDLDARLRTLEAEVRELRDREARRARGLAEIDLRPVEAPTRT